MKKIKILIISCFYFLFLISCGYTPIFHASNASFKVENYEISGNKEIGEKFGRRIKNLKITSPDVKKISIKINSKSLKTATTKNLAGDVQNYNLEIQITVQASFVDSEEPFSSNTLSGSIMMEKKELQSDNLFLETKNTNDIINRLSQSYIVKLNQILKDK